MNEASSMTRRIGHLALLKGDKINPMIQVMDARWSYGSLQYRVVPVQGEGTAWVSADRLSFQEDTL